MGAPEDSAGAGSGGGMGSVGRRIGVVVVLSGLVVGTVVVVIVFGRPAEGEYDTMTVVRTSVQKSASKP
jgi:hypothetical protein